MPRVTKKDKTDDSAEEKKSMKAAKSKASKTSSAKSVKASKETSISKSTKKTATKSVKATTTKKESKKKESKKSSKKSTVVPFKSILSRRRTKKDVKDIEEDNEVLVEKSSVIEYYDLPYRYNQTTVKILAQTPSVLFVYWDISDEDRNRFVEQYGENFFDTTKPILLVHNKTKNYSFEVEINDFANSWYLRMQEPDCEYAIELLRRSNQDTSKYIYVSSSNNLVSPNNHVLFEKTDFKNIAFKNVKTGIITYKDFGSLRLMTNIGNIYNKKHKVLKFYKDMYSDEVLDGNRMFSNPSSSNPSSRML